LDAVAAAQRCPEIENNRLEHFKSSEESTSPEIEQKDRARLSQESEGVAAIMQP
jgi:hypothetical protein